MKPIIVIRAGAACAAVALFALIYTLTACASTPFPEEGPAARLYRSYGVPLKMAAEVHESIRVAGRQAETAGLLEGENLAKVKAAVNDSAQLINTAKTTLRLLQEGGISTDLSNLDAAHQSVRNLIKLAVELGFWKEE